MGVPSPHSVEFVCDDPIVDVTAVIALVVELEDEVVVVLVQLVMVDIPVGTQKTDLKLEFPQHCDVLPEHLIQS